MRSSWGQNNLWGEPGSEGRRGQVLGGEEGGRHAQAPSPRGVQSCQEPQVLGAQLQATDLGGHAAGASMSLEMWMLSPNYTFLRSCPPGRFQDILQCFLEQFPVLFAKEGMSPTRNSSHPLSSPESCLPSPWPPHPRPCPTGHHHTCTRHHCLSPT